MPKLVYPRERQGHTPAPTCPDSIARSVQEKFQNISSHEPQKIEFCKPNPSASPRAARIQTLQDPKCPS